MRCHPHGREELQGSWHPPEQRFFRASLTAALLPVTPKKSTFSANGDFQALDPDHLLWTIELLQSVA